MYQLVACLSHSVSWAQARVWVYSFRPAKVRVRCGRPLTFPLLEEASPRLASEVTARIWPCIELQYRWLGDLPEVDAKPSLVPRPALATLGPGRRRDDDQDRRAA